MQLTKSIILFTCLFVATQAVSLECLYQLQNSQTIIFDIQSRILDGDVEGAFAGFQFLSNTAKELKTACISIPITLDTKPEDSPKYSCRDSMNYIVDTVEDMADNTSIVETIQKLVEFSEYFKQVCAKEDTSNYVYDTLDEDSDEEEGQAPHFDKWNGKYVDEDSEISEDSSDQEEEVEPSVAAKQKGLGQQADDDESDEVPPNFAKWNGQSDESEASDEDSKEDSEDDGDEDSDELSASPSIYDMTANKDSLKNKGIFLSNPKN